MPALTLELAGLIVQVIVPNVSWLLPLHQRYNAFTSTASPDWQIFLEHDPALVNAPSPCIEHLDRRTTFRLLVYEGWVDFEQRQSLIRTPTPERAAPALERVLTYTIMQLLPREREALLLHAVGLHRHGMGEVFFGASGAGKTTVATLAAGYATVITDESVIVQATSAGALLHGTPLWGLNTPTSMVQRVRHTPAPLRALYALIQAPTFSLRRLSEGEAIVALLGTEKVATERVSSATAWLGAAAQLVAQVPVYALGFLPTVSLWDFLDRELSPFQQGLYEVAHRAPPP